MNDSRVAGRPVRGDLLGSKRPAQVHGIKSLTQQPNNKLSTYVRPRKLQQRTTQDMRSHENTYTARTRPRAPRKTMGTHHTGYAFPQEHIYCAYAPTVSPRSSLSDSEPPLAQTTARRSWRRAAPGAHAATQNALTGRSAMPGGSSRRVVTRSAPASRSTARATSR